MPVTDVRQDLEALCLTVTAEFAARPERVWELYADPRQIERWFGPPTYPATFVEHELVAGGRSVYYMTSPEGEKYWGWWETESATPAEGFVHTDGFGDAEGRPVDTAPVSRNVVRMGPHGADGAATQVVVVSTYASAADLQQVLDMGVVEGLTGSINQIDALLAG